METALYLVTTFFTISIVINIWQKVTNDSNKKFYESESVNSILKLRNLKYDIMNYQFKYLKDNMDEKMRLRSKTYLSPKQIAEKYVYGKHDALTDNQQIEDMIKDIEEYVNYKLNKKMKFKI